MKVNNEVRGNIIERLLDLELRTNELKENLSFIMDDNASDLEIIEAHIKKVREDQIKQLC